MARTPRSKRIKFKRESKNAIVARLEREAAALWKGFCMRRDGERCAVEREYPGARNHTSVFQVDHCFSRAVKALFFEPANGTVICSGCNCAKGFGNEQVKRMVDEIVIDREGLEKFNEMKQMAMHRGPFPHWKKVYWLEEVVKKLRVFNGLPEEGIAEIQ